MPSRKSSPLLVLGLFAASAAVGYAAEITASGSDLTTKDAWRTAAPYARKPMDGDADYLYGTDGYLMFNAGYAGKAHSLKPNVFASALSALPDYVNVITNGATASLGAANFARIDNPDNPTEDILSGVALMAGLKPGQEAPMFKLEFKRAPGYRVRIGVLVNNAVNRNSGKLRLAQDGGGSQGASHVTAVGVAGEACYFFFDVAAISAGETLTLFVTEDTQDKNETGEVRIGGFTFDRLKE